MRILPLVIAYLAWATVLAEVVLCVLAVLGVIGGIWLLLPAGIAVVLINKAYLIARA